MKSLLRYEWKMIWHGKRMLLVYALTGIALVWLFSGGGGVWKELFSGEIHELNALTREVWGMPITPELQAWAEGKALESGAVWTAGKGSSLSGIQVRER